METRVGCYAVVGDGGRVLLAHWTEADRWTLPGGGMEPGETPEATAVREVLEETGLLVALDRLLGATAVYVEVNEAGQHVGPRRELRLLYRAAVRGGSLADEVGGSTGRAAWFDLGQVGRLPRTGLVDEALRLYDADGR